MISLVIVVLNIDQVQIGFKIVSEPVPVSCATPTNPDHIYRNVIQ